MKIVVTGAVGFIGYNLCEALLIQGHQVIGIDNFTPYYDIGLKYQRLTLLRLQDAFSFKHVDCADEAAIKDFLCAERPDHVVHLAAQAGVRYSLENAHAYSHSNLDGFLSVLEGCRFAKVRHLIFASSSSVYGANKKVPFCETDLTDHPVSLYAATKKANEAMAHSYSHLFGVRCTGLRFFTVYGPWGRPDMAYYSFAKAIDAGKPITVFNEGKNRRDFTDVSDIVAGIIAAMNRADPVPGSTDGAGPFYSAAPYRIFNLGNDAPVTTLDLIRELESSLGKKAIMQFASSAPGDVEATWADITRSQHELGYNPKVKFSEGIRKFVAWFRECDAGKWA